MKEEILILLEIYFLGNKRSEGHDFDLWMKGVSFFVITKFYILVEYLILEDLRSLLFI